MTNNKSKAIPRKFSLFSTAIASIRAFSPQRFFSLRVTMQQRSHGLQILVRVLSNLGNFLWAELAGNFTKAPGALIVSLKIHFSSKLPLR